MEMKDILKYYNQYSPKKKLKTLDLKIPLEVPFSKKIDALFF